jgi:tripartite ATP-independent transporter DctM subunit
MGEIIFRCGLSEKAYGALSPLMNRLPGGLLHSNIAVGAVFAAASGSSVASAATIGKVALPDMEKRGYARGISMGSVAAGGSLGILIPPSITFIIYGVMTQQSVGKLFIAGIFPGILLTVLYMTYIGTRVLFQPHLAPREKPVPLGKSLLKIFDAWPIFLLAIMVLGSIYGGIATPTEAAGVGAFGALVIAAGYRKITWGAFKEAAAGTVKTTCYLMLIFVGAKVMGVLLTNLGVFNQMTRWVIALPVPPIGILTAILIMYVILGCFMSGLPAIIITLPIVFPIITVLGYDPIWFGVIIVMLNETGLLTPPVGIILYILQGLRPDTPFREIALGCIPFFITILVAIAIITAFPPIATWLPTLMIGG